VNRLRHTRGFTLLELLVVIALMGVVSTLGLRLFFEMTESWRMVRERVDLDAVAAGIFDDIGKSFDAIVPPRLSGLSLKGIDHVVQDDARFWGQPLNSDILEFPVLVPTSGTATRCVLVRYYVGRDAAAGDTLQRSLRDFGVSADKAASAEVAKYVVRFEAEYLAPDGQWLAAWDRPGSASRWPVRRWNRSPGRPFSRCG